MLVVCDSFDHEDYPVYVKGTGADAKHKGKNLGGMQRLMEVYHLGSDMETQLAEYRAFNYEAFGKPKSKKLVGKKPVANDVAAPKPEESTYLQYLREAEKSLCAAIGSREGSFAASMTLKQALGGIRDVIEKEK